MNHIIAIWVNTYGRKKGWLLIAFAFTHSFICLLMFGWLGLLAPLAWLTFVPGAIWLIDKTN